MDATILEMLGIAFFIGTLASAIFLGLRAEHKREREQAQEKEEQERFKKLLAEIRKDYPIMN